MENRIIEILRDHGLYEYPYSEQVAMDIVDEIELYYELKKGKYETK